VVPEAESLDVVLLVLAGVADRKLAELVSDV
jgi:hypothetical protein